MSLFGSEKPEHRTLYYGDCLDWMSQWDDRTVDLIYLDPPFNSNANLQRHVPGSWSRESTVPRVRRYMDMEREGGNPAGYLRGSGGTSGP